MSALACFVLELLLTGPLAMFPLSPLRRILGLIERIHRPFMAIYLSASVEGSRYPSRGVLRPPSSTINNIVIHGTYLKYLMCITQVLRWVKSLSDPRCINQYGKFTNGKQIRNCNSSAMVSCGLRLGLWMLKQVLKSLNLPTRGTLTSTCLG